MKTWLLFALALAGAPLLLTGCDDAPEDYVALYETSPKAPSLTEANIAALQHMGPTLIEQGANFAVYSEHATRMELLLFDDPESERPTRRIPMARFGDVYNIYVEGVGRGQHYGYVAWGPNWTYDEAWFPGSVKGFIADVDVDGNRFNPNKLLSDPYAVALHRDFDWSKGSAASGPGRASSTWAAAAKSVIVQSQYTWSDQEAEWLAKRRDPERGIADNEAIIYEVHLKGFTADAASGVDHPGTYRGMGQKAAYFADLGITSVELMPVAEKPLDGTYWGYNPINYFAPEISFSSQKRENEVIDEFKWMVDQLHQNGIEVIVDVVYNHTGEGGFWRSKIAQDDVSLDSSVELLNHDEKEVASLYSFRGLDNQAYYLLQEDRRYYLDQTGVGNQCRTDHTPFKKLTIDSLRYWVEELHVDGFRFDLAPAMGVIDGEPSNWDAANTVLQDIVNDPRLQAQNVRLIAEPWSLWHYKLGAFPKATNHEDYGWGEWNANYRDVWRSFMNYDDRNLNAAEGPLNIGGALTGSADLFAHNDRHPLHSVNFVTAHDGFTLYDLFSYNEKRNLCGPLNPVCCHSPTNPFCDPNSGDDHNRSRDWGSDNEPFKRQLVRNMLTAMLISHGTPMILGGDEWMRTQLGNNNAYSTSADNPANWFQWGAWGADDNRVRMHDFTRKMIAYRKANPHAFSPGAYGLPFSWKDEFNNELNDWNRRHVMQHYYDESVGKQIVVLINMHPSDTIEFMLPEGVAWQRVVDTQLYFDTPPYLDDYDSRTSQNVVSDGSIPILDGKYGASSRSIVILEAE
jgi:glycogen operon protein